MKRHEITVAYTRCIPSKAVIYCSCGWVSPTVDRKDVKTLSELKASHLGEATLIKEKV